jgi:hypothetical protein
MKHNKEEQQFRWIHITSREELKEFYVQMLPTIRMVAKEHGYAIGLHGSLQRDLDLIAVPWVENCSDKESLARAIHRATIGLESASYDWEKKPHGRMATSFPMCWIDFPIGDEKSTGHIDLSVIEQSPGRTRAEE